jgi:hypothetical protein
MITVLDIERRFAEMRAGHFRQEALECPEGSQERQDALDLAMEAPGTRRPLGRLDRLRRGVFPAG